MSFKCKKSNNVSFAKDHYGFLITYIYFTFERTDGFGRTDPNVFQTLVVFEYCQYIDLDVQLGVFSVV